VIPLGLSGFKHGGVTEMPEGAILADGFFLNKKGQGRFFQNVDPPPQ